MGEAKKRQELGLPPKNISESKRRAVLGYPKALDKDKLREKIKSTIYKYPLVPLLFYGTAIIAFIVGITKIINIYK